MDGFLSSIWQRFFVQTQKSFTANLADALLAYIIQKETDHPQQPQQQSSHLKKGNVMKKGKEKVRPTPPSPGSPPPVDDEDVLVNGHHSRSLHPSHPYAQEPHRDSSKRRRLHQVYQQF